MAKMMDREKVIKELDKLADEVNPWKESPPLRCDISYPLLCDALVLLKEQKQIKSPDEFKSILLGMFDSIWDVEIDHPVFQDTVGELMEGVLQAYRYAVKWDKPPKGG